jgi:hypothetical protein
MPKLLLCACCLALLVAGCGGPNAPRTVDRVGQDNLTEVGELYRHYQFTKKKSPQKLSDLSTLRSMGGNGFEAIRNGNIMLLYNATLPDTDEDPGHAESNEVLAYEKDVPQNGGYVLLLNRVVKKMTADEFKAAPRPAGAKEGSPEPAGKKK